MSEYLATFKKSKCWHILARIDFDVLRKNARSVVYPIKVDNFAFLFACTLIWLIWWFQLKHRHIYRWEGQGLMQGLWSGQHRLTVGFHLLWHSASCSGESLSFLCPLRWYIDKLRIFMRVNLHESWCISALRVRLNILSLKNIQIYFFADRAEAVLHL